MTVEDLFERFAQEYVKDFKGGAAARRAGIENPSTSRSWASRTLARPEVAARVAQLKAEQTKRVQIEADDILRPLIEIARTDINELVEFRRTCCRHCWGVEFGYQRTRGEFSAAKMRHGLAVKKARESGADLVDEIPEFEQLGGPGFDASKDPNAECPECNGDGVGSPFIKDTRELGLASTVYAGVKVTKDGIEVKLQDRMKAFELLGKHLDLFTDKVDVNVTHSLADRMRNREPLA